MNDCIAGIFLLSPVKLTSPVFKVIESFIANIYIIHNLEVEHTNAYKVGAIFKCPFKSVLRFDSSGCQYFITHYRYFYPVNKLDSAIGIKTKHIVMKFIMIKVFFAVNLKRYPVFEGMS